MNEHMVEITAENAQALLIEESFKRPVVIDFWADWCAPCKALMPVLEKLATEYAGQFLLAKVNADEQQMISSQFGIRSLPTVMVMKDGQPVDGFAGAQPERAIRELLDKYLPKPWDLQLQQARQLIEQEKHNEALGLLKSAYTDSGERADIACELASVLVHVRRYSDAEEVIKKIKMVDQDEAYQQVKAQLELAQEAKKAPELDALEKQFAADPDNRELAFQLAVQYGQHQYYKEALELLYPLLQKEINFNEGEAKKIFMDILAVLGKGDPLAAEYQRKLYTLLY